MMILQHNACINGSCGIYAVFLNGLLWIYMGHVNWNGLMLDDQVNRFVGECWVSDVDAFVWWKVCEKHRKAERQVWSKTTERHTHMKAACSHTLVGITYRYQQFLLATTEFFCDDSCAQQRIAAVLWSLRCRCIQMLPPICTWQQGGPSWWFDGRSPRWDLGRWWFFLCLGRVERAKLLGEFSSFQSSTVLGL